MSEPACRTAAPARVAVVGGGWAGCAAAITLVAAGVPVTLFEQANTLGGRARRVTVDGVALDNGQHLVVGAYHRTFEILASVHGADRVDALFHRLPLTLRPFGPTRPGGVSLSAWRAPAPWHLAGAMLAAEGLTVAERLALIADYRRVARADFACPADETVARCLGRTPGRAFAAIWAPLCLAALNTPPEIASAQMFAGVLRATFAGAARDSDFLIPAVDLSTCFPDAAARRIRDAGGSIRAGVRVRGVARRETGVALDTGDGDESFSATIIAVGPHQLAPTIGGAAAGEPALRAVLQDVAAFNYESITTIYLGFADRVPFAAPLLRLDDAPGHWAFDRSAALGPSAASGAHCLVAVVISGSGPHDGLDQATLASDAEAQLRRLAPGLPRVLWSRVIAERRATYSCRPALSRPAHGRIAAGVYLAGDYTDTEFPATLEAATRSGVAAARALIDDTRPDPS